MKIATFLDVSDVSEERSASIIKVKIVSDLGATISETSVLTGAIRRNIQEDDILQCLNYFPELITSAITTISSSVPRIL
jgi:hypothetical protein